jgi:hypothetical protein
MRSSRPIPGNPWPHDMGITVEDRPTALLELLWIREAHDMHLQETDLPPLLVDAPAHASGSGPSAAERVEWERAWPRLWHAAAEHAGRDQDPRQFERLQQTAHGSLERERILHEIVGPSWRDEFDDAVLDDDGYQDWSRRSMDVHLSSMRERMTHSPEHRNLDALIRAWRAGLTKVVTIPCEGEYSRKLTNNALLMTDATRDDSDSYRRALDAFR